MSLKNKDKKFLKNAVINDKHTPKVIKECMLLDQNDVDALNIDNVTSSELIERMSKTKITEKNVKSVEDAIDYLVKKGMIDKYDELYNVQSKVNALKSNLETIFVMLDESKMICRVTDDVIQNKIPDMSNIELPDITLINEKICIWVDIVNTDYDYPVNKGTLHIVFHNSFNIIHDKPYVGYTYRCPDLSRHKNDELIIFPELMENISSTENSISILDNLSNKHKKVRITALPNDCKKCKYVSLNNFKTEDTDNYDSKYCMVTKNKIPNCRLCGVTSNPSRTVLNAVELQNLGRYVLYEYLKRNTDILEKKVYKKQITSNRKPSVAKEEKTSKIIKNFEESMEEPLVKVTYYHGDRLNKVDIKEIKGHHCSPRPHERRGHWRHYKSGKKVWVETCKVNYKEDTLAPVIYEVTGKK